MDFLVGWSLAYTRTHDSHATPQAQSYYLSAQRSMHPNYRSARWCNHCTLNFLAFDSLDISLLLSDLPAMGSKWSKQDHDRVSYSWFIRLSRCVSYIYTMCFPSQIHFHPACCIGLSGPANDTTQQPLPIENGRIGLTGWDVAAVIITTRSVLFSVNAVNKPWSANPVSQSISPVSCPC